MVALVKTTQIQEPSSATVNMALDTSGGVTVGQNLAVTGTATFTGGASSLKLNGATSGTTTLSPSATASGTVTLPAGTGTVAVNGVSSNIVQGTSVASTSGTTITFTGIPSWAKRITLMLYNASTTGTSGYKVLIGPSGGVETTTYLGEADTQDGATNANISTSFYVIGSGSLSAASVIQGRIELYNHSGNIWICASQLGKSDGTGTGSSFYLIGSKSLAGVLTQVQLSTGNGTDTFDAGSINILYE
jgi:hypothetical protein